jgi:hypothetical protein
MEADLATFKAGFGEGEMKQDDFVKFIQEYTGPDSEMKNFLQTSNANINKIFEHFSKK